MRILHVDTGRELRGGQRQVLLLLKGLRDAGHECVLLARAKSGLWRDAEADGCVVDAAGLASLWSRSKETDIVHVHDARAHSMAALAARVPFVVSRRVAFAVKRTSLSRWKYHRAARYLAVSQFVASELDKAGVEAGKIDVVYDGVETHQQVMEWSADLPAVALGSMDAEKGRSLVEQAQRLTGKQVIFSDDLSSDLRRASMFVYITRSEGLGSAALLAMSMGVPVIASNVGGLREALGGGEAGILVANEAQEIAGAMRGLAEDTALARTLIQRGRARVEGHFTVRRMVESTLASYRRALGG